MIKHNKLKTCLSGLMVAHREIYPWVAMIVFLVVTLGTAKPGGEAAHAGNVYVLPEVHARPCLSAALCAPSSSNISGVAQLSFIRQYRANPIL